MSSKKLIYFGLGVPSGSVAERQISVWDVTNPKSEDLITSQVLGAATETFSVPLMSHRIYECRLVDVVGVTACSPTVMRFVPTDEDAGSSASLALLTVEDD